MGTGSDLSSLDSWGAGSVTEKCALSGQEVLVSSCGISMSPDSWVPRNIDFKRSLLSPTDTFEDNIAHINAFQPEVIRGYGSY